MQDDKFNNILQNRAKEFVLLPNANTFDNVLAKRKIANRKRLIVFVAIFAFLTSLGLTVFLLKNNHIESVSSNQFTKPKSKPQLTKATIILEKKIKKAHEKVVIKQNDIHFKDDKIYNLNTSDFKTSISKTNKSSDSKLISVKLSNEVSLNKNVPIFNNEKLQAVKNSIVYFDSSLIVKQVIDTIQKTDSNLVDKVVLAKNDKDSIENDLKTNNFSINKTHYKTKEPLHFSLSIFNNYMLLNNAYNGANNGLINSLFGLNYNEQANQSYSSGFLFGLTLKKLSVKVGFAYNTVQFDKLFIPPILVGLGANAKKESLVNNFGYNLNVIDQSMSFAEIPVLLGYTIGTKKVNYTLETGLAFQYLTQTDTYLLTPEPSGFSYITKNDANNNRFNRFQLAAQASLLVNYNITKHISFYAGPIAKFHVGQYYKQEFTERNAPIYFGINSGINFKF